MRRLSFAISWRTLFPLGCGIPATLFALARLAVPGSTACFIHNPLHRPPLGAIRP